MHLLYLDDSGSVTDPHDQYFVLAGVAIFERVTHWVEQELEQIAARFDNANPRSIELHGSAMRSGRKYWRNFKVSDRFTAVEDALKIVARRYPRDVRLFGAVIRKSAVSGVDPVELAFTQVCNRFDLFLRRLHSKRRDSQRGIMVFDKSTTEQRIQTLARDFKFIGHQWGTTMNYAEVPVFLDSRASRLIQLADLIAYAIFRRYDRKDGQFFDIVRDCFDAEGKTVHGLYEKL